MNNRKFLFFLITLFLPIFGFSMTGTGQANDPFMISTPADLDEVRTKQAGMHYRLTTNLDMSLYVDWQPLTSAGSNIFSGYFHGGGHKILGLEINLPDSCGIGLFKALSQGGLIDSLGVVGKITGKDTVGGICGLNDRGGIINACYFQGIITGENYVGGISGFNGNGSQISYSYVAGNINGNSNVGGICGYNFAGGFVNDCYHVGDISGTSNVGGILGMNDNGARLAAVYHTGKVTGGTSVGGIIGNMINSNAVGSIFDISNAGVTAAIGSNTYGWADMVDGKTPAEMSDLNVINAYIDLSNFWAIDTNLSYPFFNWGDPVYPAITGGGIASDPYQIYTAIQLDSVRNNLSATYRLMNDIDLSDYSFAPIACFSGVFHGAGYKITGLTINSTESYAGLFSKICGGTVDSLGLEGDISTTGDYAGGIAGSISDGGSISQCYYKGNVSANNYIGGLTGWIDVGSIKNSFHIGDVTGSAYAGGIVGRTYSSASSSAFVENVFHVGTVNAPSQPAGITSNVGATDTFYSCYHDLGFSPAYSYWTADGVVGNVVGKTTTQMVSSATYAGFDFSDVWDIDEESTYPWLRIFPTPIYPVSFVTDGSPASPHKIYIPENLDSVRNHLDGNFILMNDLDLTDYLAGTSWKPITPFTGIFNGNGYKIKGLFIDDNTLNCAGLFGVNAGVIKNLGVEGSIIGNDTVGGICGQIFSDDSVRQCYFKGTVEGNSSVGGIAGINDGILRDAYSIGTVIGSGSGVGGVLGENAGLAGTVYFAGKGLGTSGAIAGSNTGSGSIVNACFDSLSYGSSQGGDGSPAAKTTCEMVRQNAYENFDFTDIWAIDEDGSYAYFIAQNNPTYPHIGDGTADAPYQIWTPAQLDSVRYYLGSYHILMADLDMSIYKSFPPIGDTTNPFTGHFDGNGHVLRNFTVSSFSLNYAGLFSALDSNAKVEKLGIYGTVHAGSKVGGIAGRMCGGSIVSECFFQGSVIGTDCVGGLVGDIKDDSVLYSYHIGLVYGMKTSVGGVAGSASNATIIDCYHSGNLDGFDGVDGIVGSALGGTATAASYFNASMSAVNGSYNDSVFTRSGTFATWDFNSIWDIDEYTSYPYLRAVPHPYYPNLLGTGTLSNPFQIYTPAQLDSVRNHPLGNFILMNDLDLTHYITADSGWLPIGPYYGTFRGHKHSIRGLVVNRPSTTGVGLFGIIMRGTLDSLHVEGSVTGDVAVGGIVGISMTGSSVYDCSFKGDVSARTDAGGIVGLNLQGGIVHLSSFEGDVFANTGSGGICGENRDGSILQCSSTGTATADSIVGGIAGYNSTNGFVNQCYSLSVVHSNKDWAGGLIGANSSVLRNSFHVGTVEGKSKVGGVVGESDGTVEYSYHAGGITAIDNSGGVFGKNSGSIVNCYYDSTSSQTVENTDGAKSVKEMVTASTFEDWNFDILWIISDSTSISGDTVTYTYPYFRYNPCKIYAWQKVKYTLVLDNGFEHLDTVKIFYGDTLSFLTALDSYGYIFNGWFTLPIGGEQYTSDSQYNFATDTTLYAQWVIDTFTVTFNANGGSGDTVERITYLGFAVEPAVPVRTGYTFTGWNHDFATPVTHDIVLYAQWVIDTFTVTFNANNGGLGDTVERITYLGLAVPPATPVRTGYTFKGWGYDFATPVTRDTVLSAQWVIDTFTVTFYRASDNIYQQQRVTYNGNPAAVAAPDSLDRLFSGWYINGVRVWDFSQFIVSSDTALYALWITPPAFTVKFVSFGQVIDSVVVTSYPETPVSKPSPNPVAYGYIFDGWYNVENTLWDFSTHITCDTTLYAQWVIDTFTVTFNANNGGLGDTVERITYLGLAVPPATPVRTGYTFKDWGYDFATPVTCDTTLSAQWVIDTFTVTFNANNGGLGDTVERITYFGVAVEPATPLRTGYTFKGWGYDFATPVTRDTTLSAQWVIDTFTVTFYRASDNIYQQQRVTYNGNPAAVATPDSLDRLFGGWYIDGVRVWDFSQFIVSSDTALYALWITPPAFTVKFVSFGQVIDSIAVPSYLTAPVSKPSPNPVVYGYIFDGWYNVENTLWDFSTHITCDTTLYAQWVIDTFTVTFNANNGGLGDTVERITYLGLAVPPAIPVRTGYTFKDWGYDFATPVTRDTVLYAQWVIDTFTVTFNANNGGLGDTVERVTYLGVAVEPATPVRTGYTFKGWGYDFATPVTCDTTLYAQWVIDTFSVTLRYGNGEADTVLRVVYLEMAIEPATPVRTGYIFKGWNYNFATTPVTHDIVLYAQWVIDTFTVTFYPRNGTAATVQRVLGNSLIPLPTPPVARVGDTFAGWYTDSISFAVQWDFALNLVTRDTSLYAKWIDTTTPMPVPDTFSVTFYPRNGTAATVQRVLGNSLIPLPTPPVARVGDTFAGWYTDSISFAVQWDFALNLVTRDTSLYAKWIDTTTPKKRDTNLLSLSVSDFDLQPTFAPNVYSYIVNLSCPAEEQQLTVTAVAPQGATVTYGGAAKADGTLSIYAAGDYIVTVTVSGIDFSTIYTINIKQPLSVTQLRRLWNDIIAVNLDSATNGGFNFTVFQWYKNDRIMHGRILPYINEELSDGAYYYVVLTDTIKGQTLQTCPYLYQASVEAGIMAYPNPISQGNNITIDLSNVEILPNEIEVFNSKGQLLQSIRPLQPITTMLMPYSQGIYVIKAGKYFQKVVVTK
jgi:uncharacterized repeat protein (TIGR02543 family)